MNITGGGVLSSSDAFISAKSGATAEVTVDGAGSTWTNLNMFTVGGVLNITDGGLVSVAETLTIDYNETGDGFVNMATGGMLALYDEEDASGSLADFLGLVGGTKAIRYWDDSIADWDDIANATLGEDYTLSYLTEGDLAGYSLLTVSELAVLEGDANCDDVVSADDYASVQGTFGNTGPAGLLGDANRDGVVSADDYTSVQANFGATSGLGGETPVPEPATAGLLLLGFSGLLWRRIKR